MGGPDFGFIALLVVAAFTIFYMLHTRHLERMARIEHGLDEEEKPSPPHGAWLGFGIVVIGIGIGLVIGYLIGTTSGVPLFITIPSSILISGGLGIVVMYLIGQANDL